MNGKSNLSRRTLEIDDKDVNGWIYIDRAKDWTGRDGKFLFVFPENLDELTSDEAETLAEAFSEAGMKGARVPDPNELNLIFEHRDKISGFSRGWYWTNQQHGQYSNTQIIQRFSDGKMFWQARSALASTHFVRD